MNSLINDVNIWAVEGYWNSDFRIFWRERVSEMQRCTCGGVLILEWVFYFRKQRRKSLTKKMVDNHQATVKNSAFRGSSWGS